MRVVSGVSSVEGPLAAPLLARTLGAVCRSDRDHDCLAVGERLSRRSHRGGDVDGVRGLRFEQVGLRGSAVTEGVEVPTGCEARSALGGVRALDRDADRRVVASRPVGEAAELGDQRLSVRRVVEGAPARLRDAGQLVAGSIVDLEADDVDVQLESTLGQVASHLTRVTATGLLAVRDEQDRARTPLGQVLRRLPEAVCDGRVPQWSRAVEGPVQCLLVQVVHRDRELGVLA
jgi:hypothetical protein